MTERWLPCPGYEETHKVSDFGNVMSLERDVSSCHGSTARRMSRMMKPDLSSKYPRVQLKTRGPKVSIHRLVATAFIGPPPKSDSQVNHIDGVKTNNRATNLEWVSCSENIRHSFARGLSASKKGPNNPMSMPLYVYDGSGTMQFFPSTRCASEFLGASVKTIDNHIRSYGGRYKGLTLTRSPID